MDQFGNIPTEVLTIKIHYFDDEHRTLAQLIKESTDEQIKDSKFIVTDAGEGLEIVSFTAWTEKHVLALRYTPVGAYMFVTERNYC